MTAVLTQAQWKNLCTEGYSLEAPGIFEEAQLRKSKVIYCSINKWQKKQTLQMGATMLVTYETFSHSQVFAS